MPSDLFECINCGRARDLAEAARVSRPTRFGWFILRGGQPATTCRDCKETVTYIGTAVTLFFAFLGASILLYAIWTFVRIRT